MAIAGAVVAGLERAVLAAGGANVGADDAADVAGEKGAVCGRRTSGRGRGVARAGLGRAAAVFAGGPGRRFGLS